MKFEFRIALSYLLPTRRHWSRSIMSSLSVLVISAVVWIVMVFLSVSNGLQKIWIDKLLALDAPIHIKPTKLYFDAFAPDGDLSSPELLSQFKEFDKERIAQDPPRNLQTTVENAPNPLGNLLKILRSVVGNQFAQISTGYANLQVRVLKEALSSSQLQPERIFHQLSLVAPCTWRPELIRALDPISPSEWKKILQRWFLQVRDPNAHSDHSLLQALNISQVSTSTDGLEIVPSRWPTSGRVRGILEHDCLHICQNSADRQALPMGQSVEAVFTDGGIHINSDAKRCRRLFLHQTLFDAALDLRVKPASADQLTFELCATAQGIPICSSGRLKDLNIARVGKRNAAIGDHLLLAQALSVSGGGRETVGDDQIETLHPVLLPRQFWQNGARIGDSALLERSVQTPAGPETEPIHLVICGFFDPGIMPLGGRLILTDPQSAQLVFEGLPEGERERHTLIQVFCSPQSAASIASTCRALLKSAQLDPYWCVQSFDQFDQIRDLINQLKSDQTLLTLLAVMIIAVACSNIISMLLLLVVEKRQEIAILRSLGATSGSVARIFGLCGLITGSLGCGLGALLAWGTLRHIDFLVALISSLQGRQLFHPLYYGENLPGELTNQAIAFTLLATAFLSAVAGLLPALQAARLHPSRLLRNL